MKIELYINKQLCDIENPGNFSIYLKRQFINPAELNVKDAQKSYSISLPATPRNNQIFGFKNTEEIKSKFAIIYDAYLVVGGLKIFDGKFRLSEISGNRYTGNLGVPAQKTIKEIFNDKNMNEAGEWMLDGFTEFVSAVKKYNTKENAECIFPYVMYGLLPKKLGDEGKYTEKDLWDETVILSMEDFPPSINCLQAIKKIFEEQGKKLHGQSFNLSGTAFNDKRLTELYMSYKNPTDYQMPWNYGTFGKVMLGVKWSNYRNLHTGTAIEVEPTMVINKSPKVKNTHVVYTTDLLSTINGQVTVYYDRGNNIVSAPVKAYGTEYQSRCIVIPHSGVYKVTLNASIKLNTTEYVTGKRRYNKHGKDLWVVSPVFHQYDDEGNFKGPKTDSFQDRRYEVKVIRDRGTGDFDLEKLDIDREFYKNNIDQTTGFDPDNPADFPKYFPHPGEVCFIDPAQNKNLLCGVSFGKNYDKPNRYAEDSKADDTVRYANVIAVKGGYSWDREVTEGISSAVNCVNYQRCDLDVNNKISYKKSDKFQVLVENPNSENKAEAKNGWTTGKGEVNQLIWLEKGERITIAACGDHTINTHQKAHGYAMQNIDATLSIEAFQTTEEWLSSKLNIDGSTLENISLDWNDNSDFDKENLNLIKFLPSDVKIDNWLDNFCKAFNLELLQVDDTHFELNVKQTRKIYGPGIIDLDGRASVARDRKNNSLNLPSAYEIGFTINEDEEGYIKNGEDKGMESFPTGSTEGGVLSQNTIFSYNWFKKITLDNENEAIELPVISDSEPFKLDDVRDYAEMMQKDYTNLAQRFWYKGENMQLPGFDNRYIETCLVKNELEGAMQLHYKNTPRSILNTYFTVFVNNDTHYTTVECLLAADEYIRLPYSLVRFNGDLYYPAEIDGYDPLGKRKAALKLIRKIL